MTRYLVTGGAGFIGSHLVDRLVEEEGAEVRVVDDLSTGSRDNLRDALDRIDFIEGSIVDPAVCAEACDGVEVVFHQAALASVARSVADPVGTHAVNTTGTLNLLVAADGAGVGRFVYAASSSAYGDTEELPKHEGMRPLPRSPYAAAKLTGEHYCSAFAAVHGLTTVSLRYFNVFGPRQDPSSPYSAVIPIFVRRALEGRPPRIDGDGEQTRDFTYVANVVEANLRAARADGEKLAGRVFNVGCGDRISINELWEAIRRLTGADVEAEHGPPRPGDVRDSKASLERTRAALGYEPRIALDEGLARTIESMKRRI